MLIHVLAARCERNTFLGANFQIVCDYCEDVLRNIQFDGRNGWETKKSSFYHWKYTELFMSNKFVTINKISSCLSSLRSFWKITYVKCYIWTYLWLSLHCYDVQKDVNDEIIVSVIVCLIYSFSKFVIFFYAATNIMLVALLSVFVNLRICNDSVVIIKRPYLAVLTKKYDTDLESAKKNAVMNLLKN